MAFLTENIRDTYIWMANIRQPLITEFTHIHSTAQLQCDLKYSDTFKRAAEEKKNSWIMVKMYSIQICSLQLMPRAAQSTVRIKCVESNGERVQQQKIGRARTRWMKCCTLIDLALIICYSTASKHLIQLYCKAMAAMFDGMVTQRRYSRNFKWLCRFTFKMFYIAWARRHILAITQ